MTEYEMRKEGWPVVKERLPGATPVLVCATCGYIRRVAFLEEHARAIESENKALRNLNATLKDGNKCLMEANPLLRGDMEKIEDKEYEYALWAAKENIKYLHSKNEKLKRKVRQHSSFMRQRDTWMRLYALCRKRACRINPVCFFRGGWEGTDSDG